MNSTAWQGIGLLLLVGFVVGYLFRCGMTADVERRVRAQLALDQRRLHELDQWRVWDRIRNGEP